jgi:hypothetical protein
MKKEPLLAVCGAVFFWGCAAMTVESEAKVAKKSSAQDLSTPSGVIEALDGRYQAALADLELTEEKMVKVPLFGGKYTMVKRTARFGGSRMVPVMPAHANLLPSEAKSQKFQEAIRKDWRYAVTIFGRRGKPLSEGELQQTGGTVGPEYAQPRGSTGAVTSGRYSDGSTPNPKVSDLLPIAKSHLAGGGSTATIDDWTIEARTVHLSKPECLNCHKGSKLNDPIAVLVYNIRRR